MRCGRQDFQEVQKGNADCLTTVLKAYVYSVCKLFFYELVNKGYAQQQLTVKHKDVSMFTGQRCACLNAILNTCILHHIAFFLWGHNVDEVGGKPKQYFGEALPFVSLLSPTRLTVPIALHRAVAEVSKTGNL